MPSFQGSFYAPACPQTVRRTRSLERLAGGGHGSTLRLSPETASNAARDLQRKKQVCVARQSAVVEVAEAANHTVNPGVTCRRREWHR